LGIRFTGRSGSGFQLAMVRAHSRACAVVGDAGEAPPQVDRSREFAPPLVDGADRSLVLGDGEHRWSVGRRALVG
jgi:hypothetical protein